MRQGSDRTGCRRFGAGTAIDLRDQTGHEQGEAAVTEHPNVELTRRGYDAFSKGDLAVLAELPMMPSGMCRVSGR